MQQHSFSHVNFFGNQAYLKKTKKKKEKSYRSPAGNRTPVSRVTGGDTHHYTTEDLVKCNEIIMVFEATVVRTP